MASDDIRLESIGISYRATLNYSGFSVFFDATAAANFSMFIVISPCACICTVQLADRLVIFKASSSNRRHNPGHPSVGPAVGGTASFQCSEASTSARLSSA